MAEPGGESAGDSPLQGYFDWQVTTLMLAMDLTSPIPRDQPDAVMNRRRQVEQQVRELSLAHVPKQLQADSSQPWPPEVLMAITRATLDEARRRAG